MMQCLRFVATMVADFFMQLVMLTKRRVVCIENCWRTKVVIVK